MSAPLVIARCVAPTRWALGILIAGLILAALAVVLYSTLNRVAVPAPARPDTSNAMRLYRAGEWAAGPVSVVERPAGWAAYRAGERAAGLAQALERPAGWAAYRAGERAAGLAQALERPAGWAAYRAGERAP